MLILTNTISCVLYSYLLFWLKPQGIRLFCSCSVPCLVSSLDSADPQLRCLDRDVFSWVLCLFPLPRKVTGGSSCMQRALTQDGIHRDGPTYVLPAAVQLMVAFKPSILCPLCFPCSTTRVPSLLLFFQASLRISTHLHIRSDPPFGWILLLYRLKSETFPGIWLAKSGAQRVCVHAVAERWNYMITNCRKSRSRLGWAEDLIGFVGFFFALLQWKLGFWNSSVTTKEKHSAAGWVVSWPACTVVDDFCVSIQASCSEPDTHPAHIPSSRASNFKNLHQFLWSNQWLEWSRSSQLSFGGEYPHFHCRFLLRGAGRYAAAALMSFFFFWDRCVLKCMPVKKALLAQSKVSTEKLIISLLPLCLQQFTSQGSACCLLNSASELVPWVTLT